MYISENGATYVGDSSYEMKLDSTEYFTCPLQENVSFPPEEQTWMLQNAVLINFDIDL